MNRRRLLNICAIMYLLIPASMHTAAWAAPDGQNTSQLSSYAQELIRQGNFEKGLEQLSASYRLFPMNEQLKRSLAEGYAAYGHSLIKLKRFEQAEENYLKAAELYPDDPGFALLRGICTYRLKKYDVARYELERSLKLKPDFVEALYYLGLVQYETDNRLQAMELWEQALRLAPKRSEIADALARARRETAVEKSMDRGHSSRFNLTYDPGVNTTLALSVLDVLENAYNQVGAAMGHFPEARIPVVIYQRDDFKAVTDSPDWSGGLYDGTIRLPFGTMTGITPPMRGILFHEYAHVVVFDLTRGNCPVWLNEGIAEMFGRSQYNRSLPDGNRSATGRPADFKSLERSFTGLSGSQAAMAYQQSYSLVNYTVTTYGWHRVRQMLVNLGNGMNPEEAISAALQDYSITYEGLVKEWQEYIARSAATG
jgi:tetratricopeptide (TPR) repeat protein